MKNYLLALPLVAVLFSACSGEETTSDTQEKSQNNVSVEEIPQPEEATGINPPAPGVNVPFMKQQLTAEKGGAFVYETGSVVTFPENAVLHTDGTPVTGEFDVEYREFHDPIDIYFSGIPMAYDSMETTYNFVSAGMCELKAYQNGEELMVNPAANPSVDMVSKDADPAHNLYYYDETEGKWMPKGKPAINDIPEVEEVGNGIAEEPAKPKKKDPAKHSFFVTIDPSMKDVSEFAGFDKMHFQIADQEKGYSPADAKNHWTGIDVKKSPKYEGKYQVTFTGPNITKTYLTDPVFSDEQYEKAMSHYNKVLAEYEAKVKQMETAQAEWEAEQAVIIAQNRKVDSINKIIAAQNAQTIAFNDSVKKLGEEMAKKELSVMDSKTFQTNYSIMRGFAFSSFGVWNCDNPMLTAEGTVPTKLVFTNKEVDYLLLVSVIYKDLNTLYKGSTTIRNIPDTEEIIFFTEGETLYYGLVDHQEAEATLTLSTLDISNISFNKVKKKILSL